MQKNRFLGLRRKKWYQRERYVCVLERNAIVTRKSMSNSGVTGLEAIAWLSEKICVNVPEIH